MVGREGRAARLSATQRALLEQWLPGLDVVADLSWDLVDTTVLHVRHGGVDLVVKASGPGDHHLGRELRAYAGWTATLADSGHAPRLVHGDHDAHLAVVTWLDGHLVLGSPDEDEPRTYAAAGALLRRFHDQASRPDDGHQDAQDARTLGLLDGSHRIGVEQERRVRELLTRPLTGPRPDLVPTHGDCQPRNWLTRRHTVSVIDFGRADWRPRATDLARLAVQQFDGRPDLEAAFVDGYGGDPRTPELWARIALREAVGTAAWAHRVGDEAFEAQGLRMLSAALAGDA